MADLGDLFVSPNESDRNGEPANVVDGLFAISRALKDVAKAIDQMNIASAVLEAGDRNADAIYNTDPNKG